MGTKLSEFLARQEDARRSSIVSDLEELTRRVKEGERRATPEFHNWVRGVLCKGREYEPSYVEVPEGTTWEGVLADFEVKYRSKGPKPFHVDLEVRALVPGVRPGIYEIFTWSDQTRDGDVQMAHVREHFKRLRAPGLVVPFMLWCIEHQIMYGAHPAPWKRELGAPRQYMGKHLGLWNYNKTELVLARPHQVGYVPLAGTNIYVGAKFIE